MAIPVISEILSFLQSLVQSMPKSMKYVMFLFFLIVLVWLMPVILHLFGFHCDHDKVVRTTSALNFIGNMEIAFTDPNKLFNSSEYHPTSSMFGVSVENLATTFYTKPYSEGMRKICSLTNTTDCVYGILYTPSIWSDKPQCMNCTNYTCVTIIQESGGSTSGNCICMSDAYRKNDDELNWFQKAFTCDDSAVPPKGFYYKQSTNKITCFDFSVCGLPNESITTWEIDKILDKKNAKAYYNPNMKKEDYNSALLIKCNNDFQPELTIFGIPVFSLQIWLGLFVLGLMFFFLSKVKQF